MGLNVKNDGLKSLSTALNQTMSMMRFVVDTAEICKDKLSFVNVWFQTQNTLH